MNWCSDINMLAKQIHLWRENQGFYTPCTLDNTPDRDAMLGKLMLVCSEVGEATEAVRKGDDANFREEIADTIIRLLDISDSMKMDIFQEIASKMDVNEKRPIRHNTMCTL